MNHTLAKKLAGTPLRMLALAVALSACAGPQTFKEGKALLEQGHIEQGLAKLEEAVRQEPGNAEYRIGLLNRKASIVNAFNGRAEQLRQQGNFAEAEKLSAQVLAIDPANTVAQQGMQAIALEQRHKEMVAGAEASWRRAGEADLAQALDALRVVLQERPNQRDALALKSRIADEQAKKGAGSGKLAAAYRKPVTLEFRDAPVRSVFDFLGKVSGLNFVFDRDVDPALRTTISVRNTSLEEAIRMLLSANQLEQTVTGERAITIYPNTVQKVKDYQQLVVRSFYLTNADAKTVSFSIKTLLKAKDIVTDDRLGIIMMRDTPDMIRMAERIIAMQDMADPEVMLEVEVLEVKRTRLMELGIRWPDKATLSLASGGDSLSPLTVASLGGINRGRINVAIGSATINANQVDTDGNILANPRIRVRNKEKAKIHIGDRVPVITVTTNNGVSSESVNYLDVGLKLDVEPNVNLDDEVAIKINLEVSTVVKEIISKLGTQAYQIGARTAGTVLRLKDGETQVLAGLISDEDRRSADKLPGFGDLPVLKRLFGSQKDDTSRSEIVLSITPRILRGLRRPDLMTAQFDSGTESNVGGRGPGPGGGSAAAGAQPAVQAPEAPPQAQPAQPSQPEAVPSPMTGGDEAAPQPPAADSPAGTGKPPGTDAPRKVIQ
ncbi:secretin and TonB N-terminal domain-containing protein [Massilia sp. CCM 9210]|uniref:secretin and TonB N-terminal domain-containing protein n=1 Tax=Massilia scottii TaxID=3057166 RepID=UPI002796D0AA|nr:secretin and TonB N-terminal domain-containing protein [Massilia sp. CCM 9210]MDQ1817088.1 secretin and TonB N-terminal domain-containing protein [Massilia sp. CCM 9210]